MWKLDRERLLEILCLPFRESGEKPRLVRISRAHVSGVSYLNIGDAGIRLLKDIAESGMMVKVRTTLNPGYAELSGERGECSPAILDKQREIAQYFIKMGAHSTFSCTPYLEQNVPKRGEHMAWAESSAVLYSNSVIGAWTNKESGIGALAAGIIGATSRTGVHTSEGRRPRLLVEYEGDVEDEVVAGALGYVVGERSGDDVPLIESEGLLSKERAIEYLAAQGASGASPMSIIRGMTPLAIRGPPDGLRKSRILDHDIRRVLEGLQNTYSPEAILIGCPHMPYASVRGLLSIINGRPPLPVFAFVSRRTKTRLAEAGLLAKLRSLGINVIADACVMWCGLKKLGYRSVVTNSVKGAHYLRNQMRVDAGLAPLSKLFKEQP